MQTRNHNEVISNWQLVIGKLAIGLIIVGIVLITNYQLLITGATAQTAQVLLTWQANNFYPADYAGKALATQNTPVSVAVEVVRDGKLLDLSDATFKWFVDEKLLLRTDRQKEVLFTVSKLTGDSHFVRVKIERGEEVFESSTRISISEHTVVAETPYPNNLTGRGGKVTLSAVPYFFNINSIDDMLFSWQVNDTQFPEGRDNHLVLNIGAPAPAEGEIVNISVLARNSRNFLEFARERTRIIIR